MMYEVREIDNETGKVTHVMFQIRSYEEALKAILKRCFGDIYYHDKTGGGLDHWYNYGHFDLWSDPFYDGMRFEFDDVRGPSTMFVYEIMVA